MEEEKETPEKSEDETDSTGSDNIVDESGDEVESEDDIDSTDSDDIVDEAETDNILEDYSSSLVNNNGYGYSTEVLLSLGEPTPDEIDTITAPINKVINEANEYMANSTNRDRVVLIEERLKKFDKDNQKYIDAIYSQFEMKKSADIMSRVTQQKTGVLDPVKMLNYKTSDDIFSKKSVSPIGKNHTITIMVDYSASMSDLIYQTTQQLFILMEFCQKANIPFEVYTWSDMCDTNIRTRLKEFQIDYSEECSLRKIFSSEMTTTEYNVVKKYMYLYVNNKKDRLPVYEMKAISVPNSCTPIAAAYYYGGYLAENLRRKTSSQVGNMIMISDGGGYNKASYMSGVTKIDDNDVFKNQIRDLVTGKYYKNTHKDTNSSKLLDINRDRYPNVNQIGFYASSNISKLINDIRGTDVCLGMVRANSPNELTEIRKSIRERGAAEMKAVGYDAYYMFHATKIADVFDVEKNSKNIKRGKNGRVNVNTTYKNLSSGSFGAKRVILSKLAEKLSATS